LAPTITKLMGFDWTGEGEAIPELIDKN
jgi:hypothetical protein